jgi:alkylhydroperoxidase family enzyme
MSMNMPPEPPELAARLRESAASLFAHADPYRLLRYQDFGGTPDDRAAGRAWLKERLPDCTDDTVLVCPGIHSALVALVSQLARRGETICLDTLAYPGIKAIASQLSVRLQPLPRDDWDADTRALLGADRTLNVFATLAHHPKLLKRWLVFGNHVLAKSTLPARDRELLILRTGWNCRAPYEWGQHVAIARGIGISDDEIERVAAGPDADGWSEADALLLRAADELHTEQTLSDPTYAALAARYDAQGLLDVVFTVGQYHLVSIALNTFRVERDDGVTGVSIPARE